MVVLQYLILTLLASGFWMILTAQVNLEGFLVGIVISLPLLLMLLRERKLRFNPLKLPLQLVFLVIYTVILAWDILLSGIDVVLRILGVRPINPGIAALSVQEKDEIIAGLTAHGITITPGQLVVDFGSDNTVYVHNLDIADADELDEQQTQRLRHLRRIVGKQ
jgi:multicomponent Na+:H+ antiporter subunit E